MDELVWSNETPVERIYTKKEVIELISKYSSSLIDITDPLMDCFSEDMTPDDFLENWCFENLK